MADPCPVCQARPTLAPVSPETHEEPPTEDWRDLGWIGDRCCRDSRRLFRGDEHWRYCVCAHLEYCPTHHRLTHVGSHE